MGCGALEEREGLTFPTSVLGTLTQLLAFGSLLTRAVQW
jgi:hypothetical protein